MSINVGTAVAYLTLDRSGFKNGLRSAGADLKKFATGTGGAEDRVKSLGNALTSTGKALAKPSIAAGTFLGAAVKTAGEFEAQMSKVQAISGATSEEMKQLEKTAREWGAKTKFSAKESAEAMEFMGMAGWKAQEMIDGLPGILNLAAASGEELGTTSDIVTDALTAFGLQAKDSAHFADLLASAASNSNTNVSMLGESFKYVAPVAGALGISAKDTSFALGLMANAGIKGSAAGTALRASLVNLSEPTKQQKKAMDKLGISLTDASGKVKSGKVLFDELREKFSGLTEAQKTQYAATIFGKEAMSGMLAIINASDKDYNKLYKNLSNCNGEAEKMANTMQDNLKGAITNLKSAFEEMQISITKAVVPILTKVVKVVTKVVNVFNALPQPIKSAIGRVIGAIALLSPTFLILGKMVKTVSTVIGAFKKLKIAAMIFKALPALITPHTLIIVGALAAIIAITIAVIKNWDKCKAAAKKFGKAISKIFKDLLKVVKKVVESWIQQFKNLVKIFEWVGKMLKLSVKFWLKVLSGVIKVLKKIVGGWINLFKNLGKKFFGLGKNIVQGLINGIKSMFGKVSKVIKSLGDKVKNGFKKALKIHSPSRVFASYGGYIGEGLIEGIDGQEGAIDTKFKGLANKIKDLGNVKSNLNFGGLNNLALSGASGNGSGFNNISNSNKNMGITQNVKMYITIPNANKEGAKKVATEFKNMTKSTLKDEMTELFMNDVLRD